MKIEYMFGTRGVKFKKKETDVHIHPKPNQPAYFYFYFSKKKTPDFTFLYHPSGHVVDFFGKNAEMFVMQKSSHVFTSCKLAHKLS